MAVCVQASRTPHTHAPHPVVPPCPLALTPATVPPELRELIHPCQRVTARSPLPKWRAIDACHRRRHALQRGIADVGAKHSRATPPLVTA